MRGGAQPPAPPTNIKNKFKKWKSQINVSRCPVNFTLVQRLVCTLPLASIEKAR